MSVKTPAPSTLRVSTPAPRDVWRRVLSSDPDALPSQAPEWVDALCDGGRYRDASRLYEAPDGTLAVLPLVARRHRVAGAALHSMPAAWGFGGPVAEGGVSALLLQAVMDDLAGLSALRVHLRPNPLHAPLWSAATLGRARIDTKPARAQVLDLSGGFEAVWRERFRSETRTSVRKAERLGVQVETDTAGRLIPVFHHLLQTSVDRWAEQQHEPRALARLRLTHRDPLDKLEAIAAHLGDACRTSIAWYDGRPVAGVIVLRGRNAHFTRAAMDKDLAGPTRASTLLQKVAIEDACAAGCRWYHMGESSAGSGVSDFKQRLGAVAHEYAEYFVEPVPFLALDRTARTVVKRLIGFRDA